MRKSKVIIPEDLLPQFDALMKIVLNTTGLPVARLNGESRKRELVDPRRAFISVAIRYCTYLKSEIHRASYKRKPTLHQLGKYLGNRDHSSIHSLLKNVDNLLKYDKTFERLHVTIELGYTELMMAGINK